MSQTTLFPDGICHMNDNDLLAILVGSDVAEGLRGQSLVNLFGFGGSPATHVVQDAEAEYLAHPVLGAAKELVSRALSAQMQCGIFLSAPAAVCDYLKLNMRGLLYEVFQVLFLDTQNRLLASEEMFRGTLTQASVYPREVVRHALDHNAAAIIFAHNHPSGLAEPSRADEVLTRNLKQALALVDVKVLDHFIVAGEQCLSFAERGLL